ncbi:hypothetical protein CRG98_002770 [Punica granatum]|nr:hypothetical protein CRG98_002770 [Punica granatum]
MGKYMKKSRVSEVSPQQALASGVRTRAKTLALQRQLQAEPDASSLCYLQLRNRRLHKLPPPPPPPPTLPSRPSARRQQPPRVRASPEGDVACLVENGGGGEPEDCSDGRVEASFGENNLESEEMVDRNTRESTPCSSIRDPSSIGTPGSTTRRTPCTTSRRVRSELLRDIPTMQELEEFFALAEQQQQRLFLSK